MAKSRFSNEEKERRYRIRKVLRLIIMAFATATIVLAVLCLAIKLSFIYPLITYIITAVLTYIRNRYDFHDIEENIALQQKINDVEKSKKLSKTSQSSQQKKRQKNKSI